jgi:hypothetical protein
MKHSTAHNLQGRHVQADRHAAGLGNKIASKPQPAHAALQI